MVQAIAQAVPRSWSVRLGSLIRPPVTCAATTTATDAAALMARERTPWLLVPRRGGFGIVTEQHLSVHVLASGRSPRTPVGEITAELSPAVSSDRSAGDVLLFMIESGLRHVPVVDAHRRVLGVVSDTDLVGLGWRSALMLQTRIELGHTREAVAAMGRDLPRVVVGMDEGADPVDVGRMVTLVIDALTRRFIELALEHLGEPPVPWAWLTLGSSARREQAIITDQDHALAFDLQDEPLEETDGTSLSSPERSPPVSKQPASRVVAPTSSPRTGRFAAPSIIGYQRSTIGWTTHGRGPEGRRRSSSTSAGRRGLSRPNECWGRSSALPRHARAS